MRMVSQSEFFAVMNPLDVHPRVDVTTLRDRIHVSRWELPTREIIGISKTDSHGTGNDEYFLIP